MVWHWAAMFRANWPNPLAKSGRAVMIGRLGNPCPQGGPLGSNRMARISAASAFMVLLAHSGMLAAHPGHGHSTGLRTWKDMKGILEVEASFVRARDDMVQLRKED